MDDTISRKAAIAELDHAAWGKEYDKALAKAMLESLPTAQQWIPCSERLPDNEKRVLCTVQSGEHFCVVPCIFIQHTRRWLPEVYGNHDNVIAWMPLPEPWKEEQDD